jgi:hypothetical protein
MDHFRRERARTVRGRVPSLLPASAHGWLSGAVQVKSVTLHCSGLLRLMPDHIPKSGEEDVDGTIWLPASLIV